MIRKPTLFIGSSSEGIAAAEALQASLEEVADVELWTQGIFDLSFSYLESLVKTLDTADFAILVLTPDDLVDSRGRQNHAPRDNVLFELGLFMGRLGRRRCFFVFEKNQDLKIPTDLLGIAAASYRQHANGNMEAALGVAAGKIKRAILAMGRRPAFSVLVQNETPELADTPDISGNWTGYSPQGPNPEEPTSSMVLEQHGSVVHAIIDRKVDKGMRRFEYEGRLSSGQLVMFFEDQKGRGFIIGAMVLHLSGDLNLLIGMSTFYHHTKNEVVSEKRLYRRIR